MSGSSSGALVAAAFATDKLVDLKTSLLAQKNWYKLFPIRLSNKGFIDGSRIYDFLRDFFEDLQIEDTDIKLFLQVSDITDIKEKYLRAGSVAGGVFAAMTLPGFFIPEKFAGKYYFDGGGFSRIPSKIFREHGYQPIIGVFNN